ncbi:histidine kinase [Streptomyces nigrescens]|uniref:histidine kinase n=2 Tax=Streptomyces nigrescens TaxID=1920 RepID=A0A640TD23_STRNI|nr:histidine kinase [Streptomyces libani subsp. libani]GGW06570.1 histidine kinase [Streptomyces libani subsp. libani]
MGEKEESVPRPSGAEPSGSAPFPADTPVSDAAGKPGSASRTADSRPAVEATARANHGSAAPKLPRRTRPRLGWPRRVFSQVLMVQLAIATGVTALATGLFLAPLSTQLDDQAMRRALAIAQTTAAGSRLDDALEASRPTRHGPVQNEAERIRAATGAEYVVIMDKRGVRWSHTDPDEIGRHVSTDPSAALSGQEVMQIDEGTLGRSARGKVPLRDEDGTVVGAVSVGIAYESVQERLLSTVPQLLAYAGGALAVGALAAYLVSRRLQRRTHDLAFSDISALLAEREAMLHGIREGFLALDKHGRIRLMNDEAQRLLDLRTEDTGHRLEAAMPPGRTTDVLVGRVSGPDLLAVSGQRVLVANRMPTDDGGAVVTLRDRTELERLGRELDGTRGLIDALRAQDHEHANRLHTLLGLLELGLHEEAVEFVTQAVGVHRATAEQVTERIHDPLIAALLVGKATVATERGVSLSISPETHLPDRLVDPPSLVTILGNLVDNALDATSGKRDAQLEAEIRAYGRTAIVRVSDNGPGVPEERREEIFTEGWTTKEPPAHGQRGIGLALVCRLAERYGGNAEVAERPGGGAVFTVTVPDALSDDLPEPRAVAPQEAVTGTHTTSRATAGTHRPQGATEAGR